MSTAEERIERMHKRAEQLQKNHDKKVVNALGTLSAFTGLLLIAVSVYIIGVPGAVTDAAMAGSSLLSENAGGYVLVAVISFTVAVLVTALCLKSQMRKRGGMQDDAKKGAESNGV